MGSRHSKNWQKLKRAKQIAALNRQIAVLKSMPKDYRDLDVNSRKMQDWLNTVTNPKSKQLMLDWIHGPILYLHPLTKIERQVLGAGRLVRSHFVCLDFDDFDVSTHFDARLHKCSFEEIVCLINEARLSQYEGQSISFVYIKNLTDVVFRGLNALASYSGMPFRFKLELVDKNGVTPGL